MVLLYYCVGCRVKGVSGGGEREGGGGGGSSKASNRDRTVGQSSPYKYSVFIVICSGSANVIRAVILLLYGSVVGF